MFEQRHGKLTESKGSIEVRLSDNFCRVSGGDRLFSMLTKAIFRGSPVETHGSKNVEKFMFFLSTLIASLNIVFSTSEKCMCRLPFKHYKNI